MFTLTLHRSALRAAFFLLASALCVGSPRARADDVREAGNEIVVQAVALIGVPYRWGGNDPARGLDCSGLVRHVFKVVAEIDLPRRSEEISRVGRKIARADLRPGDLLFFNTLGQPFSHVGVYMGDGRFVHAPGRNGQVRVDQLDERYWRRRFNGARRIDLASADGQTAEREAPAPSWRANSLSSHP